MKHKIGIALAGLVATLLVGCNTISGTITGAGIGYIMGDAEWGADVGATVGLVKDIWGD